MNQAARPAEVAVAAGERVAEAAPVRVLFIGGLGRSGSTLLDRMLGQLDGVWSVGELVHIWQRGLQENNLCGCGRRFRDCILGWLVLYWTAGNQQGRRKSRRSSRDRSRHAVRIAQVEARARFAPAIRLAGREIPPIDHA